MGNQFNRYSRQMLFAPIGEKGQAKLMESTVLIIGMGALGTNAASQLVRAGVGHVRFADRDYVEMSNLQRQMLFDEEDVSAVLPKAVAAERKLKKVNRDVKVEGIVTDVTAENIEELLQDVDLVVDGTDNFATRFLINDACFKHGIPYVYGGAVSSRGMSALFIPGRTICLRCLIKEDTGSGETCDTVGVITPVVDMVVSYQIAEAMKYLVGDHDHLRNSLISIDVWHNRIHEFALSNVKRHCSVCDKHEYPALSPKRDDLITSLCGRETVQIKANKAVSLEEWAGRLEKVAEVKRTPFLLRVQLQEGERLVLFPDGRTLVQGTEDVSRAKTLYARYIGL